MYLSPVAIEEHVGSEPSGFEEAVEHLGQVLSEHDGLCHDLRVSHDRHSENPSVGEHAKAHPYVSRVDRRRDYGTYPMAAEEHRLGRTSQIGLKGMHQPLVFDEQAEQTQPAEASKGYAQWNCRGCSLHPGGCPGQG